MGVSRHPDPTAAVSKLTYEQAAAALEQQRHALETLRGRAGTLLTGATLTTSFLGGRVVESGELRATSWVALGCFLVVGLVSLATLWPQRGLDTTARLPLTFGDHSRSIVTVHEALARYMHVAYDRNERHLQRIATYLRGGMIMLAFEVILWVADLAVST